MNGTTRMRPLGALAAAAILSGCVGGLLGGGKPDRLYRFGTGAMTSAPVAPTSGPRRLLTVTRARFAGAVAGDRILTVDGTGAAYVKDARWLSPASVLYDDAVQAALRARAPDIGIATGAAVHGSTAVLAIGIDRFEASLDGGGGNGNGSGSAVPTIRVEGTASLIDARTRAVIARHAIAATQVASNGGETAIVAAFDAAATRSAAAVADWANAATPVPPPDPKRR